MNEHVPGTADSAEPVSQRRAPGDGPPSRPAADDEPPAQSPPADTPRAQSPPADGPSPRSVLGDKARAVAKPATARPRRTAADGARKADERSRRSGATADDAPSGRERPGASSRRSGAGTADDNPESPVVRERPGGPWPVPERSLMATVLGVNPAAAVGVAAALTAIGVAIDLLRVGTLSTAFTVCYLTGCVLATAWVRRSGVFWPMVAPPLLMAIAVPVVVLVAGTPRPGAGVAQRLLVIGAPLVNGFPIMAWTTGIVLALGAFRLITQRVSGRPRGRAAARAAGRTSTSRPPS